MKLSLTFSPALLLLTVGSAQGRDALYQRLSRAFQLGVDVRNGYASLFGSNKSFVWNANSQERVLDSADNFALGALGINYTKQVTFNVLPQTSVTGPGSLFGYETCPNYNMTYLSGEQAAWKSVYVTPIVERLNSLMEGYVWNVSTVANAQTMCQYETAVSSPGFDSPWCKLFTPSEQVNFEWDNDINYLQYAYTNLNATALGGTYVQRVVEHLRKGSATQGVFATFSHDNSIMPILTALGMYRHDHFDSPADVPTTYSPYTHEFRAAKTGNFAGNFYIELLLCDRGHFVRLQNNQAVYPLSECGPGPSGGPDGLCELERWLNSKYVKESAFHGVENGAKLCGNGTANLTKVDQAYY